MCERVQMGHRVYADNMMQLLEAHKTVLPSWVERSECAPPMYLHIRFQFQRDYVIDISQADAYFVGSDHQSSNIALPHASVDANHAVLCHHPCGVLCVIDLNSDHGTFVTGVRIEPYTAVAVTAMDSLRFGTSRYEFRLIKKPTKLMSRNLREISDDGNHGVELFNGHLVSPTTTQTASLRIPRDRPTGKGRHIFTVLYPPSTGLPPCTRHVQRHRDRNIYMGAAPAKKTAVAMQIY
eukprot:GFYU01011185.1.p1 GENE.GFYU01011185.1~~GFYU01011185.1.p1  ORF type:complete len:254 (-),score=8.68 GFYU01011185.1:16-726(-)